MVLWNSPDKLWGVSPNVCAGAAAPGTELGYTYLLRVYFMKATNPLHLTSSTFSFSHIAQEGWRSYRHPATSNYKTSFIRSLKEGFY